MSKKSRQKSRIDHTVEKQNGTGPEAIIPSVVIVGALGVVFFFLIGWIYQSSWYGYYGIDVVQLDLPFYLIIAQGAFELVANLGLILILFAALFMLRLIALYAWNLVFGDSRLSAVDLLSFEGFFRRSVHFVLLLYLGFIYWFMWTAWNYNGDSGKINVPGDVVVFEMLLLPLVIILLIRACGDLLAILPRRLTKRLRWKSRWGFSDGLFRNSLAILVFLATCVVFSGISGVGEASVGFRYNGGWGALPRVYLVSYAPIAGLERFRHGCSCNPYAYGPLGYLADNDDYLIMIPWKADGQKEFTQSPDLMRIEHSQANPINIVREAALP